MKRYLLSFALLVLCLLHAACNDPNVDAKKTPEGIFPLGAVDESGLDAACVAYASCISGRDVGACIRKAQRIHTWDKWTFTWLTDAGDPFVAFIQNLECVKQAGSDCTAVRQCLNAGQAGQACPEYPLCEGDELVFCQPWMSGAEQGPARNDCSALQLECLEYSDTDASSAICSHPSDYDGERGRFTCEDDVFLFESSGVKTGSNCSLVGAKCAPDEDYGAICQGLGKKCDDSEPGFWCEDNWSVTCLEGRLSYEDCEFFELDCESGFCGYAACDEYEEEHCVGDQIEYCTRSGTHLVDCVALGYSACEEVLEDEVVARCLP